MGDKEQQASVVEADRVFGSNRRTKDQILMRSQSGSPSQSDGVGIPSGAHPFKVVFWEAEKRLEAPGGLAQLLILTSLRHQKQWIRHVTDASEPDNSAVADSINRLQQIPKPGKRLR